MSKIGWENLWNASNNNPMGGAGAANQDQSCTGYRVQGLSYNNDILVMITPPPFNFKIQSFLG